MNFTPIIQAIKGSARSGNFGHAGRPGMLGGSDTGGGHAIINVTDKTPVEDIRTNAVIYRKRRDYALAKDADFKYQKVLSLPGLEAVYEYTGTKHVKINNCLRSPDCNNDSIKTDIKNMDEFFEVLPLLKQNVVVRRGIAAGVLPNYLKPGDEIEDKGFVSTTIDPITFMGYMEMEIYVPKGSKAAYVKPISQHAHENELLLNRNARFKVLSVEHDKDGDLNNVVLEYVK